jgi:hypothetical protein
MADTRPSGTPIFDDVVPVVTQEPTEIDGRGRLHLLPRWLARVNWAPSNSTADFEALVVLAEPGLISMRDWETAIPAIAARYAALKETENEDAVEAMRLIHDRYVRLSVDRGRRPHLGDAILAHLGLSIRRGEKSTVYVAVYSWKLEVLSANYRNSRLLSGSPLLDDLP